MRVLAMSRLRRFFQNPPHVDSEMPLRAWYRIVNHPGCDWQDFHAVKATFGSASHVGNCVVFNIGGNKYRLVVQIDYETRFVFIKRVMTHREYDEGRWKADCDCFPTRSGASRHR